MTVSVPVLDELVYFTRKNRHDVVIGSIRHDPADPPGAGIEIPISAKCVPSIDP